MTADMSKEPVYIKEISITDYKCFKGENKFSFYDDNGRWCQWTVFLGNNNTGKTNLLKAIAAMEPMTHRLAPDSKESDNYLISNLFKKHIALDNNSELKIHVKKDKAEVEFWHKNGSASISKVPWCTDLSIFGYGVVRELENQSISNNNTQVENAANLLNSNKLINFESWLFQLDYSAKNAKSKTKEEAERRLNLSKNVLTSGIFPEISDIRFTTNLTDKILNNYIEYKTDNRWLKFSSLGYGYQSSLSWIADFCKKMFDKYPDSENPLKEPAVLLIDEIDLHLHPQWQRTIIEHLSDIFPHTQFIVTTHSPFVLQSMDKVNLYTLHHQDQEITTKHWGNKSFIGWGIEEILSEVMELNDDIKTNKYQQLINSFNTALDSGDYKSAKKAYTELSQILHPSSEEHTLLKIQLSQLTPEDD